MNGDSAKPLVDLLIMLVLLASVAFSVALAAFMLYLFFGFGGPVKDPYAVKSGSSARVYFTLRSGSFDGQITRVESPDAQRAYLYQTGSDGRISPLPSPSAPRGGLSRVTALTVPGDGEASFAPDGFFVMLEGLKPGRRDRVKVVLSGPRHRISVSAPLRGG